MDTYTNIRIESTYDGYIKGGGEILYYLSLEDTTTKKIDWGLVVQYQLLPYLMVGTILLMVFLGVLLYFKSNNIRMFGYKGLNKYIGNYKKRRGRDEFIIHSNRFLTKITSIWESTPFKADRHNSKLAYNLKRINWTVAGGYRVITIQEYNAIMKSILVVLTLLSIILATFVNGIVGLMLYITSLVVCNVGVRQTISGIVASKDLDIRRNFSDLYFMLHYVLLSNGKSPTINIFSSYFRSVENKNMKSFVKNCIDNFDLYGELEGASRVAKEYSEIYEVQKLMKLIIQFNKGGEIKQDLIGFRSELIETKKYMLRSFTDRLILKANIAMKIVFLLLWQTAIGVLSIYFEDILKGF